MRLLSVKGKLVLAGLTLAVVLGLASLVRADPPRTIIYRGWAYSRGGPVYNPGLVVSDIGVYVPDARCRPAYGWVTIYQSPVPWYNQPAGGVNWVRAWRRIR